MQADIIFDDITYLAEPMFQDGPIANEVREATEAGVTYLSSAGNSNVIANDKPIVVSYKGEILFPVLVDYPEEKFGGFLAVTNYRDPYNRDEIESNGWMIWPPIRYSFDTPNTEAPTPAPSPPAFLLSRAERCAAYAEAFSDHPIALSVKAAYTGDIDRARIVSVEEESGHGVSAHVREQTRENEQHPVHDESPNGAGSSPRNKMRDEVVPVRQ